MFKKITFFIFVCALALPVKSVSQEVAAKPENSGDYKKKREYNILPIVGASLGGAAGLNILRTWRDEKAAHAVIAQGAPSISDLQNIAKYSRPSCLPEESEANMWERTRKDLVAQTNKLIDGWHKRGRMQRAQDCLSSSNRYMQWAVSAGLCAGSLGCFYLSAIARPFMVAF